MCSVCPPTRNFTEVEFGQIRLTSLEPFSYCNSEPCKVFVFLLLLQKFQKEAIVVLRLPFFMSILVYPPGIIFSLGNEAFFQVNTSKKNLEINSIPVSKN